MRRIIVSDSHGSINWNLKDGVGFSHLEDISSVKWSTISTFVPMFLWNTCLNTRWGKTTLTITGKFSIGVEKIIVYLSTLEVPVAVPTAALLQGR
mmetsp:Transcript_18372/g.53053  ORF Transcript_18372/g.53053 Transcript_18372/m.53053 type:complete len:95 (+) Transcript_18372:863-1147(+)